MSADLYEKLSDKTLLRRAWHLARNDSRTDFMFDPYRYSDFGYGLDDILNGISRSLATGTYHPKPLWSIDVPKSSLSVRPGTVLAIEDKVVLFAIALLIAPPLDKKLPDNVYSWRVKKSASGHDFFQENEILKYPFLKGETIRRKLDFVEPWYGVWGEFIGDLEEANQQQGYDFLVTADVVSYFENIDLGLLRDLLLRHLPQQQHIVNFLINLLKYWTWPAIHGAPSPRGIPQGNGVSSFLGNIYLLPLDQVFLRFIRNNEVKYFRYMDDVKVLTKNMATAREAVFLLNNELRSLRLNIQGSKTGILRGEDALADIADQRLDAVNEIIKKVQKKAVLSTTDRERNVEELKAHLGKVKGRKGIIQGKELRLFRRLITAFTLLRHSGMVRLVLDQLQRNPDARLLNSAVRYLRVQDRNLKRISQRLAAMLSSKEGLFPYQEAHFFLTMRYMRNVPDGVWAQAWRRVRHRKLHWYARQQAALLIGLKPLQKGELQNIQKQFYGGDEPEIRRAWLPALSQLDRIGIDKIGQELTMSLDPKLQRLGRFYHGLLTNEAKAKIQIESIFRDFRDDRLLDRMFEVELLSKSDHDSIKQELAKALKKIILQIHRPLLKKRIDAILNKLSANADENVTLDLNTA